MNQAAIPNVKVVESKGVGHPAMILFLNCNVPDVQLFPVVVPSIFNPTGNPAKIELYVQVDVLLLKCAARLKFEL